MQIDFNLLKLLSSKLCHDLMQPAHGMQMSMNMLKQEDTIENNQEAFSIALESIDKLVQRLTFFRMSLGGASLGDGEVALQRTKELILDLFKEKDTKITWESEVDKILLLAASNSNLKVILNIFLVAFYIMQKNTKITVYCSDLEEKIGLALEIKGQNVKLGLDNIQALRMETTENELTPRNVQSYYSVLLAREAGSDLEVRDSMKGEIQIACTLHKMQTSKY